MLLFQLTSRLCLQTENKTCYNRSMKIYSTAEKQERALLVVVLTKKGESKNRKTDEITRLALSTDLEVEGVFSQTVKDFNRSTVIGSGKVDEIAEYIKSHPVDVVIVDYKLTGSQIKNLSNAFGVRVIDRVGLILDIFARGAKTNEAKLQVKLAQNLYNLPRLSEIKGTSGRYGGGGVGMRGPGETKLELDRRLLEKEIDFLKKQIAEIKQRRNINRREREKNRIKRIAIVGYTNAGKSSLLNVLTRDNIYADDKYFATLDTTSRKLYLEGETVMITDTVGFISELPHELVDAFSSTLEEAKDADLILHVVDPTATSLTSEKEKYFVQSMAVTNKVLDEIGATENRIIVYNKSDLLTDKFEIGEDEIFVSAKKKEGLDELKSLMKKLLDK